MQNRSTPPSRGKAKQTVALSALEWDRLNAVLVQHLALAWTSENEALLKRELGAKLFAWADAIIKAGADGEEWHQRDLSSAGDVAAARLREAYPQLGDGAIGCIVRRGQYGWR